MTKVKFIFNFTSAYFHSGNDHITVGLDHYADGTVSDEEIVEHVNWQIEHEVMHKILYEHVSWNACQMFDSEEFKLRREDDF